MITVKDENGHSQVWPVTASTTFRAQRRIRCIVTSLPAGARVLELGCGHGDLTQALVQAGHRVTAVDRSESMLAHTRDACLSSSALNLVSSDVSEYLRSSQETFDAVVGMGILHHCIHNLEEVAALLSARLTPQGCLLFWEPNRQNPVVRFLFGTSLGRQLMKLEPEEDAFRRDGAARILARHFSQVEIQCRDWAYPFMPVSMQRLLARHEHRLPLLNPFIAQSLWIQARRD